MKILLVAGYFAPYSPASASRSNKLAKYLEDQGHDIRVLAPKNDDFTAVLTAEISPERVLYTGFSRINNVPNLVKDSIKSLFGGKQKVTEAGQTSPPAGRKQAKKTGGRESKLSLLYRKLTNIPDDMIGWYPSAVAEGRALFQDWSPEIIFATLPPFTTMLVANRLGTMIEVPVIYDYRDLWTDHPYYGRRGLRKFVDRALENHALKNCAGLVTVTRTWATHLQETRNLPVEFVMNGYDPADFNSDVAVPYDAQKITLLYAGYLYGDKRDPSIVFEALGRLGPKAQDFNILLYTPSGAADLNEAQRNLIAEYGLEDVVQCHPYIAQKELLQLQQQVDVLMLLRWDDPSENGVIAGKLFEYIGAGRQILVTGSTTGEAADIVRDNGFGLVSNEVDEVAAYLEKLLTVKQKGGAGQMVNSNREKFTRARQFEKLVSFMERIVANHR